MDEIEKVEAEVDKVLQLFASNKDTCNKTIEKLLSTVVTTRQELNKLIERKFKQSHFITNHNNSVN